MQFKRYRALLLDGDGVLWKSDSAQPGLKAFLDYLGAAGVGWALLTNNNTRTLEFFQKRLHGFEVQADISQLFSSSSVTADYLAERFGTDAPLHVIGMEGLTETLLRAGFSLTVGDQPPEDGTAAVVVGMDREINIKKITVAMRLIHAGAAFVATNTDGAFPTPDGLLPGTGAVVGAIQFASGVEPVVVGKPQGIIFQQALNYLNCPPAEALMVGDRLETDILGARQLGIHSAALLSGVSSRELISRSKIQPDFIYDDIRQLHRKLEAVYRQ